MIPSLLKLTHNLHIDTKRNLDGTSREDTIPDSKDADKQLIEEIEQLLGSKEMERIISDNPINYLQSNLNVRPFVAALLTFVLCEYFEMDYRRIQVDETQLFPNKDESTISFIKLYTLFRISIERPFQQEFKSRLAMQIQEHHRITPGDHFKLYNAYFTVPTFSTQDVHSLRLLLMNRFLTHSKNLSNSSTPVLQNMAQLPQSNGPVTFRSLESNSETRTIFSMTGTFYEVCNEMMIMQIVFKQPFLCIEHLDRFVITFFVPQGLKTLYKFVSSYETSGSNRPLFKDESLRVDDRFRGKNPRGRAVLQYNPSADTEMSPLSQDLIDGLTELHNMGVVHFDINPWSIFETQEDGRTVLKIAECSTARFVNTEEYNESKWRQDGLGRHLGHPYYEAPEMVNMGPDLTPNASYCISKKMDIWSLGLCFYQMRTRKFVDEHESNNIENIVEYKFATDRKTYEKKMKRIQRIRRGCAWNNEYKTGENSILNNAQVHDLSPSDIMQKFFDNIKHYNLTEMLDPNPSARHMSSNAT